jgi:hypothetical protein
MLAFSTDLNENLKLAGFDRSRKTDLMLPPPPDINQQVYQPVSKIIVFFFILNHMAEPKRTLVSIPELAKTSFRSFGSEVSSAGCPGMTTF